MKVSRNRHGDVQALRVISAGGRLAGVGVAVYVVDGVMIDTGSFLVIVFTAALAGTIVAVAAPRFVVPVVVVELVLGIVIGPHGLDLAQVDKFIDFFASFGLGMLFFFAGY